MARFCDFEGISCHDMRPAFVARKARFENPAVHSLDHHPNRFGHSIASGSVPKFRVQLKLLSGIPLKPGDE